MEIKKVLGKNVCGLFTAYFLMRLSKKKIVESCVKILKKISVSLTKTQPSKTEAGTTHEPLLMQPLFTI